MTTELERAAADLETILLSESDDVDGVVTIAFNRPDSRNALNDTLRQELLTALDLVESSPDVRVLVLTGSEQANAFVAGGDVTELRERDVLTQREKSKRPRIYDRIDALDMPVIARINGHAVGGGCELALAADVRVISSKAKIGQPEINLGLIPGSGGTQRLTRLVGEGHAMRLILTGQLIDAAEAVRIGMAETLCEPEELDEQVNALAAQMAKHSPLALEFAKKAVRSASRMSLDDGLEYEAELFALLFAAGEKDEGIDAFFEDREPNWTV